MEHYRTEGYDCQRSIGYLLRRATTLTVAQLESAFAEADITFSQWVVLMQLRDGLAHTASDLARNIGHDTGALTRLIDQLEHRGLLKRSRCQDDRRVVRLHMTETGRAAAQMVTPIAVRFYNTVLDGFSTTEVDTLITLLSKFLAAVGRTQLQPKESKEPADIEP